VLAGRGCGGQREESLRSVALSISRTCVRILVTLAAPSGGDRGGWSG
jgi:hypothetical protein